MPPSAIELFTFHVEKCRSILRRERLEKRVIDGELGSIDMRLNKRYCAAYHFLTRLFFQRLLTLKRLIVDGYILMFDIRQICNLNMDKNKRSLLFDTISRKQRSALVTLHIPQ